MPAALKKYGTSLLQIYIPYFMKAYKKLPSGMVSESAKIRQTVCIIIFLDGVYPKP